MKIGVQIEPQFGYSLQDIIEIVQTAEKNGFTHAWFSDHFILDEKATHVECHETLTTMTIVASQTSTLRIGSLVLCNSYRHPAVLAKQLTTLDHFSHGRLEFGYGAGWKELEYKAYGIEFPSTATRIAMLDEALQVIKKLWTEEKANFIGKFYQLREAIHYPKPVQKPHPPIWIGTIEAKEKMLSIIAKHADGINISWAITPEKYQEKLERLEKIANKFNRKVEDIKKSCGLWTRIYADEEEKTQTFKEMAKKRGISLKELQKRLEGTLHGTVDEIMEKLRQYKRIGITHLIVMFPYQHEKEQIRLFSKIISKI